MKSHDDPRIVRQMIEELTSQELYRLTVYHPRLRTKFAQIVRAEYDDFNIAFEDIEAAKDKPR